MTVDAFGIIFVDGIHIPDLETFHNHLLDIASEKIAAGEELGAPTIFILSPDGKLAIMPAGALSKQGVANLQKMAVRDPLVRACALVFEAWTSHRTDEARKSNPDAMPVDDPNRGEAVIVSILTAGRQAMTFSPIRRPANTVEKARFEWLDESKTFKKASGRFVR
jgi:hypothetical protein